MRKQGKGGERGRQRSSHAECQTLILTHRVDGGGEGLINVAGITVGTRGRQGVHWVSTVVKATVGAVERIADSQQSGTWQEKTNYIHDVTKPTFFADVFKKMLR